MSGRFVIGALAAQALESAAQLHRAAFAPLGERTWTQQELAELLAAPGVNGSLLQLHGIDVAFALYRIAADEAELLTIAVDPAHRRRGAGRALLAAVIEQVRALGACSVFLEVGADNPAARTLYERAGFEAIGRRAAYYQRGSQAPADAVVMRLKLAG